MKDHIYMYSCPNGIIDSAFEMRCVLVLYYQSISTLPYFHAFRLQGIYIVLQDDKKNGKVTKYYRKTKTKTEKKSKKYRRFTMRVFFVSFPPSILKIIIYSTKYHVFDSSKTNA